MIDNSFVTSSNNSLAITILSPTTAIEFSSTFVISNKEYSILSP